MASTISNATAMNVQDVLRIYHTMCEENGPMTAFNVLNISSFRENLLIPHKLWKELSPILQEELQQIRNRIQPRPPPRAPMRNPRMQEPHPKPLGNTSVVNAPSKPGLPESTVASLPPQYPAMTPFQARLAQQQEDVQARQIAYLCNTFGNHDDMDETDDDVLYTTGSMVTTTVDNPVNYFAHLEYISAWLGQTQSPRTFAVSDSGADATILGSSAKVISYSGRKAIISGYDPNNTKSGQVPIVTALLKVRTNTPGQVPILLRVHEAPYLENSPITLLSEYQIREHGLVIDSVATKHRTIQGGYGTQSFYVTKELTIPFEDGGL